MHVEKENSFNLKEHLAKKYQYPILADPGKCDATVLIFYIYFEIFIRSHEVMTSGGLRDLIEGNYDSILTFSRLKDKLDQFISNSYDSNTIERTPELIKMGECSRFFCKSTIPALTTEEFAENYWPLIASYYSFVYGPLLLFCRDKIRDLKTNFLHKNFPEVDVISKTYYQYLHEVDKPDNWNNLEHDYYSYLKQDRVLFFYYLFQRGYYVQFVDEIREKHEQLFAEYLSEFKGASEITKIIGKKFKLNFLCPPLGFREIDMIFIQTCFLADSYWWISSRPPGMEFFYGEAVSIIYNLVYSQQPIYDFLQIENIFRYLKSENFNDHFYLIYLTRPYVDNFPAHYLMKAQDRFSGSQIIVAFDVNFLGIPGLRELEVKRNFDDQDFLAKILAYGVEKFVVITFDGAHINATITGFNK